jgi:undecaprenyl-diphosphatase
VIVVLDAIWIRRPPAPRTLHQSLQSRIRSLAPLLALAGLLAIAIAMLTNLAAGPGVLSADVTFGRWLQGRDIPFASSIAAFGNAAGSSAVGVPLALGVIGVTAIARRWSDTLFLLGLLLARLLNAPLKAWAGSPRPPSTLLHVTENADGLGFPSGHAMGVVLLAGGLAYVVVSSLPAGRPRVIPWGIAVCVILATGYGRVETGAHWPTDVLGGYLWGALLVIVAVVVRRLIATDRAEAFEVPRETGQATPGQPR